MAHDVRDVERWEWGVWSEVELASPNIEFVRVLPMSESPKAATGSHVLAQTFTAKFTEQQWVAAGIGHALPVPGWPPTERDLPSDYLA